MVPMPNAAGSSNFIRQPDITDDNDRFSGRFDLRGSANDNIFVRYSYNKRFRFVPGWFGGLLDGSSTSAWGRNDLNSQSAVSGWTKILGPSVVNEFRFAWSQGRSDGYQDPKGEDGMAAIGFTGVPAENRTGGIIGVDVQGLIRMGSPNFMPKYQHTDQMQFIDTMSWLRGAHQFKFGAEITAPMKNNYVDVPATRGDTLFRNNMFTGSALADFLLGYATSVQLSNFHEVHQRQHAYSFFVQDDFRATDRLTLNLGLRYDFVTPQMDAENRVANFDPATGQLYLRDRRQHRRSRAGGTRPQQLRPAPRHRLQGQHGDGHPRRLRHLLQPRRADGIGRSAVAQSSRAAEHQHHRARRIDDSRVDSAERVSAELPRRVEHQLPHAAAANGAARRQELDVPSVRRRRRASGVDELRRVGRRRSDRSGATSRCCET